MTSEGPHHPGYEPDEVAPGGGGSAPYGGQPAPAPRPGGAPDLGWAPPPPVDRTDQAGWRPGHPSDQDRPDQPGWDTPAPARPVRATASVPVPGAEAPPAWDAPPTAGPQRWPGTAGAEQPERPAAPAVEPWGPGEAWRPAAERSGAQSPEPAAESWGNPPSAPVSGGVAAPASPWGATPDANPWGEPAPRAEAPPMYQPAPSPGFSAADAVPLPPQEQRVPGASLASVPPVGYQSSTDYPPSPGYAPPQQRGPVEDGYPNDGGFSGEEVQAHPADRHWPDEAPANGGWDAQAYPHENSSAPAAVVPQPRISPESVGSARVAVPRPDGPAESEAAAAGSVTASASVPVASRVMPPTDLGTHPAQPSQPRVYGRPARPEPEPEEVELPRDPSDHRPGYDQPEQYGGYDQHHGYDQAEQQGGYDQPEQHGGYDQPSASARVAPPLPPPAVPIPDFSQGPAPFGDLVGNSRPVNGVKPQTNAALGAARTGGPERFGDPSAPVSGAGDGSGPLSAYQQHAGPGRGPQDGPDATGYAGGPDATAYAPMVPPAAARPVDPAPGDFGSSGEPWSPATEAWTPSPEAWGQDEESEQAGRFDSFKPEAEPKAEPPTPKVRNGRVLLAVLTAAVLLLVVPLGALWLLGKFGGDDAPAFDPAVSSCVKQSGNSAVPANCGDPGTFSVVSKVDAREKCADKSQPYVVLPGSGPTRVLCLKPAAAA